MKADLWLRLRKSSVLRRVSALPAIGSFIRTMSYWMAPQNQWTLCRVKGGIAVGLLFELSPRWNSSAWEGTYEHEVQDILRKFLSSGQVFYDIGAGIGYYSCAAARLGARVYAFEPSAISATLLLQHARVNHVESAITLVPMAVSSQEGSVWLLQQTEFRGHANSRVVEKIGGACDRVETTTLDHFALVHPVPTICKVDVEGYETEVLKSAEGLFSTARPVLICEVHDQQNESFIDGWLATKRYAVHWLRNSPKQQYPVHLWAHPVERMV